MASKLSEEDFSCPVCRDIFTNPVVQSCGHNVCEECIQKFWESKESKECPVCRRRSSKEIPPVNFTLKNLCETFRTDKTHKAVIDNKMATSEDDSVITQDELEDLKELISTQDLSSAVDTIKHFLDQQDHVELNIAVTGESGSGKSTFINAFRGLGDDDEDSAETGVVEITKEPKAYKHPKYKNVKLWDLPGIRTLKYLKLVQFERYDFFIIIASDRFRECHADLVKEIKRMKKNFYFVRSKIDSSIDAERRKKNFDEKKTLDNIREDCVNGLREIGVEDPFVFLISSWDLNKYDFNSLHERMETELPEHKRHVLMLTVPNITPEIIERKKKSLEKDISRVALLSACGAAVPVPGLSVAVDIALLVNEIQKYKTAFGLDDESLKRISERSGKSIEFLKSVMKSGVCEEITTASIILLLRQSSLYVAEEAVERVVSFIPIIGSALAAGLPFVAVSYMLKKILKEIAEDGKNVLLASLNNPTELNQTDFRLK
ncbi:interferon-inducible GTPase 5-like [Xyrauchen texanus]|uniref:interferon-inducible GTPase 5-like n=1 Tax=Xyrauchen texanus TaxID=154827 RepID=UPI0022429E7E|nr:interferon-inducible GTPase 5-like [Xyrauchen texanus]